MNLKWCYKISTVLVGDGGRDHPKIDMWPIQIFLILSYNDSIIQHNIMHTPQDRTIFYQCFLPEDCNSNYLQQHGYLCSIFVYFWDWPILFFWFICLWWVDQKIGCLFSDGNKDKDIHCQRILFREVLFCQTESTFTSASSSLQFSFMTLPKLASIGWFFEFITSEKSVSLVSLSLKPAQENDFDDRILDLRLSSFYFRRVSWVISSQFTLRQTDFDFSSLSLSSFLMVLMVSISLTLDLISWNIFSFWCF